MSDVLQNIEPIDLGDRVVQEERVKPGNGLATLADRVDLLADSHRVLAKLIKNQCQAIAQLSSRIATFETAIDQRLLKIERALSGIIPKDSTYESIVIIADVDVNNEEQL